MTSTNKLIIIAALAAAAFLYTRKAQAAQATPASVVRPTVTGAQPSGLQSGLTAAASLVSSISGLFGGLGLGGRVSEAGDASSNAGEAAAQSYFMDNRDLFAVNPPHQYGSYSGPSGGWLDSQ